MSVPDRFFALGDFPLACGRVLPEARLGYRVYGALNDARDNLVLYPSSYGARPEDIEWVVGPILDPQRCCIVLVSQFGNGVSSSPSNSALGLRESGWELDHRDNLRAQVRLLEEVFGVERPALVYGWSMGAQQAYHWGVLEPGRARALCCLCGTARTTPHNQLFLLSLRQALTADPTWTGIGFAGIPEAGLRTFALIYASWAASQPFYRQERHRWLGFESVEAYVEQAWLPAYRRHDPRDLLTMIDVWLANDVAAAAGCGDDLAAALARVTAPTLVLAGSHDLYFTPDDCAAEAALLPCGQFGRLESVLGHRAGNPRDDPALQSVLRHALDALLAGGAPPELPLPLGTSPL